MTILVGDVMGQITGDGIGIFNAYKMLKDYNTWPVFGGILKQTAKFINGIKFIDHVNNKMSSVIEEDKKATADLIKKFNFKKA